jgi:hypothetical protein
VITMRLTHTVISAAVRRPRVSDGGVACATVRDRAPSTRIATV